MKTYVISGCAEWWMQAQLRSPPPHVFLRLYTLRFHVCRSTTMDVQIYYLVTAQTITLSSLFAATLVSGMSYSVGSQTIIFLSRVPKLLNTHHTFVQVCKLVCSNYHTLCNAILFPRTSHTVVAFVDLSTSFHMFIHIRISLLLPETWWHPNLSQSIGFFKPFCTHHHHACFLRP